MLKVHSITRVIDVRTVPRSRHNPQFGRDALPSALADEGIGYEHAPGLGGFRRTHEGSPNTGWRNLSFRGYADYMQTTAFAEQLADLIVKARRERIALMRLAWDFIGSEFGSRHQQYEKFYGGASFLVKMNVFRAYDFKAATAMVDRALGLPPLDG